MPPRPVASSPAERGPSLESIYRVSLRIDLCEGNKIISFRKFISPQPFRAPQKEKKIRGPWARAQCAHWLRRPCPRLLRPGGGTAPSAVVLVTPLYIGHGWPRPVVCLFSPQPVGVAPRPPGVSHSRYATGNDCRRGPLAPVSAPSCVTGHLPPTNDCPPGRKLPSRTSAPDGLGFE